MTRVLRPLPALLVAAVSSAALAQVCEPVWDDAFGPGDLHTIVAVSPFDEDGAGPKLPSLYVGGNFEALSGRVHPNFIARLSGRQWAPVGGGIDATVSEFAVFDEDGPGPGSPALFAAGLFTRAGGAAAHRVARWDGSDWSEVGDRLQGGVSTLLVADIDGAEALYAGGSITAAGAALMRGVARWDGIEWSPLGEGLEGTVRTLAVHDDGSGLALYAGGDRPIPLSSATEPFVARWDGAVWQDLPGSFSNGRVRALASFDSDGEGLHPPSLIAGGDFETINGVRMRNVAHFDDAGWQPLQGGLGSTGLAVYALRIFDEDGAGPLPPRLFVAGDFNVAHLASGVSIHDIQRLARWDGETWSRVGPALWGDRIWDMCAFDPDGPGPAPEQLVCVGSVTFAGFRESQTIASWDGQRWRFPGGGVSSTVLALASGPVSGASPEAVYAAGHFRVAGDGFSDYLARLDEDGLAPVGPSPDNIVHAVCATDPDGAGPLPPSLFIGGEFLKVGFINAPRIARWDGEFWWPMGVGANGIVRAFATFDEDGAGPERARLFVGGEFGAIGDATTDGLATWDDAGFHAMQEPLVATSGRPVVRDMIVHDDGRGEALFVAGSFTGAGEVKSRGVIRWDGTQWSDLSEGVGGSVYVLAVHDDGRGRALYASGVFSAAGGETVNNIARWDGASWEPLGEGLVHTVYSVRGSALASADLAGRRVLIAGGSFDRAGGQPAGDLAIWNGATWSALENDVDNDVSALLAAPDGNGAFVGGEFQRTGTIASSRIARLLSCTPACYADCDGSGELDVFDFLCFQNQFAAREPEADCDGSGDVDFFDFLCFQDAFTTGCP